MTYIERYKVKVPTIGPPILDRINYTENITMFMALIHLAYKEPRILEAQFYAGPLTIHLVPPSSQKVNKALTQLR
jgi:hypothetical protein